MINAWIGLQIGAELLAIWAGKKYEEYFKRQEETQYDNLKNNRRRSNRLTRLPRYLETNFGIRRGRINGRK